MKKNGITENNNLSITSILGKNETLTVTIDVDSIE